MTSVLLADVPAAVQSAANDATEVIEIVANRPSQAQKIDRRIYRIKDDPRAAQFDGVDLLRGLPAVTIMADDHIMLLGATGVTFLADERPIAGDPILYLRTLRGGDIERIEIMTNPSAQYATGTAGVINIVLRKRKRDGLSGSTNIELGSHGSIESGATLKHKKGNWSYELQAQGKAGRTSNSTYTKNREALLSDSGRTSVNKESGGGSSSQVLVSLASKIIYTYNPQTSITGEVFANIVQYPSINYADFVGLTPDFASFSERSRFNFESSYIGVGISLNHQGRENGEVLRASLGLYGNPNIRQSAETQISDSTGYSIIRQQDGITLYGTTDWVRTVGKTDILSLGVTFNQTRNGFQYAFSTSAPDAYGSDAVDSFNFNQTSAAAYGTLQHRFGQWAVMPGLRLEGLWRTVSSPVRPSAALDRTTLSPTLHVERPLGKRVNMTLSYSRRFEAPGAEQLRPFAIVTGPLSIEQGNPDLKEQVTGAYEINLSYSHKTLNLSATLYDRETSQIWTNLYTINDEELNVLTPVNIGDRSDRGAQFDIRTPLFARVKADASINLFSSEVPILTNSGIRTESRFRYIGGATLEWHGKERRQAPGDIAQVQLTYVSPTREFEFRRDRYVALGLAYTHNFSPTLSIMVNASGIGAARTRHWLLAPSVRENYEKREGPEFRLRLVKTLGNPGQ